VNAVLSRLFLIVLVAPASPVLPNPGLDLFTGLDFRPVVGGWAEYEVQRPGQPPGKVKVSVVGKQDDSTPAYWLEIAVRRSEGRLVLKLLTVGHPGNPGAMKRLVAQLAPEMVVEFPIPPGEPTEKPPAAAPGTPSVAKSRAGTFKAFRRRTAGGGVSYSSPEVPVFGLVKGDGPAGRIELVAFGTGATSEITGRPQRLGVPFLPGAWSPVSARDGGVERNP
jgi:hypothetical protein